MSFSRKRVALACTYCRHRKRRCNAGKPACQNCLEAQVECEYDDAPSQRIDTSGGTREIISRLRDIEAILEGQADSLLALSSNGSNGVRPGRLGSTGADAHQSMPSMASMASMTSVTSPGHMEVPPLTPFPFTNVAANDDMSGVPPLTIPVMHKTSSSYLLSLPAMRALIGEYPTDLFFILESRNPLPPALSLDSWRAPHPMPRVDRTITDYLVSAYFSTAHESHPVLDEAEFRALYALFLERGADTSIESALCMTVLAIGAVSMSSPSSEDFQSNPPGMEYMQHALPTLVSLSSWSFSYSILLPQAMVLASIYFAYLVRPLQSWRLIYSASTILQFKLSGFDRQDSLQPYESFLRMFWSCFLIECDRLAELELPRSSLQLLSDETSLPTCDNLSPLQSTCYLAEISIRRLLNRVHNSLYPRKQHMFSLSSTALMTTDEFTTEEITAMQTVCDELRRQLDLWHSSIPEPYRPSLEGGDGSEDTDRQCVLRIRYFAARHIIYRPFVLYIVGHGAGAVADSILDKASLCIESCRLYLHNVTHIIQRPSQYTWTFSLSSLAAAVVLTLSSINPTLKHLVPDIDELQTVAIRNIRLWAMSSLEAVVSILEDMQRKQRLLSRV